MCAYRRTHYYNNRQIYIDRARKRTLAQRSAIREIVDAIKMEKGCARCGYNEAPEALDFDHISGEKRFCVAAAVLVHGCSIDTIKNEIDKCQILCANCHRIVTRQRYRGDRTATVAVSKAAIEGSIPSSPANI